MTCLDCFLYYLPTVFLAALILFMCGLSLGESIHR